MGKRQSKEPPPPPPMEKPWRNLCKEGHRVVWDGEMEQTLLDECLHSDLQLGRRQVRILVLGATGSGKSSFINSLYSALLDRVGQYAHSEASATTVTPFLYNPPLRIKGKVPYFRILDAPGIMEKDDKFYTDFVTLALQGHLKEDVQLHPGAIARGADHYVETPGVMDRPCLVVFVMNSSLLPNSVLKRKLDIAKTQARQNQVKLTIVRTKADLLSAAEERVLKNADVKYIFQSQATLDEVTRASTDTGLPQNLIFPVTNYTDQTEPCKEMNIVLLYTLSKLLYDAKLEARNRLAGPGNPD